MYKLQATKASERSKKYAIIAVIVVAAITLGVLGYNKLNNNNPPETKPSNIDYSPGTEQDQKAADEQKDTLAEKSTQDSDSQDYQQQNISVVITYAGQSNGVIEVNSYTNHYEDGTCTIVLTQGANKFTKDTPAYRDATTTICTNPLIQKSDLPAAGEWSVEVLYASASGSVQGKSQAQVITIE